jgi:hypothetical protein
MDPFAATFAGRNAAHLDYFVIADSSVTLFASDFSMTWVQLLNQLVRDAYPTVANGSAGGLGWIPVNDIGAVANVFASGWPVDDSTGSSAIDLGPIRGCDAWTGGGNITYTPDVPTTSVQITFFDAEPAGSMGYDNGAGVTGTLTNTQTLLDRKSPPIPLSQGQTLTITLTSGVAAPSGILHFNGDEGCGITFHAMGRAGWCAGTEPGIGWNVPEDQGPGLDWAQGSVNSLTNVAGFMILLGSNDGSVSVGNRTGPEFESDLAALIATYRASAPALADCPLRVITAWEAEFRPWADPDGWPAYGTAGAAAAAADVNGSYLNLADFVPSYYDDPSSPLFYPGGGGHPSDLGEMAIAEAVFSQMAPARPKGWSLPLFTGGL